MLTGLIIWAWIKLKNPDPEIPKGFRVMILTHWILKSIMSLDRYSTAISLLYCILFSHVYNSS